MQKGNIKLVEFDSISHRYFYGGKELKGVTTIISKNMGKKYPSTALIHLASSYGSQIHREVERWIEDDINPVMEDSKWVVDVLKEQTKDENNKYNAEVRVSDFEYTASNVDIVLHKIDGVILFDIKTGKFDRTYCTTQLNAYRVMYENSYHQKVLGLYVINTKARKIFTIEKTEDEIILQLLSKNKK